MTPAADVPSLADPVMRLGRRRLVALAGLCVVLALALWGRGERRGVQDLEKQREEALARRVSWSGGEGAGLGEALEALEQAKRCADSRTVGRD